MEGGCRWSLHWRSMSTASPCLGQQWWARTERSPKKPCDRRKLHEKETRFSVAALTQAAAHLRQDAPETHAIFIVDRGFDCWPVLQAACTEQVGLIVRAKYDRRLDSPKDAPVRYLHQTLQAQRFRGKYTVQASARDGHPARVARMHVQATRVTLLAAQTRKRREPLEINAVLARECHGPQGQQLLSWLLLTTEPINTFAQICAIVRAYPALAYRRAAPACGKRGGRNVEDMQLRSREAMLKWAILHPAPWPLAASDSPSWLAATPTYPPSRNLVRPRSTPPLCSDAGVPQVLKLGDRPSVAEVVRLIADIGGYTGKSSGGPPGPTVIARGLERVAIAAEALASVRKM